jgi:multicomponent K+:H+ antiporter subunit E
MSRIPPLLTLVLVAMWLLLNNSASFAHLFLGLLLAVFFMVAAARLRPVHPRLRRLRAALPLVVTVLMDIVRSNIGVAMIVLGLVRDRRVTSGFIDVPLDLRDPHGLSILAAIITSTPGTAWAGLSDDGSTLKLHVLDLKDEGEWVRAIKERYERPLMRIFE